MINCLLIDDDPAVHIYMRDFIGRTAFLNLVAFYLTPNEALKTLLSDNIQLIYMDVDLPGITGIEFYKLLNTTGEKAPPQVILISSFQRYAIQGYKINAVDYLLKPISYENFIKATYKAKALLEPSKLGYAQNDYLILTVDYEAVKVYLKDVLYFEGFKNFVKVYTTSSPFLLKTLITIKNIEEKLPPGSFIRIHRSFIVSIDKIESISKNAVKIGKANIPVTDLYKDEFKKFTDQWF